MVVLLGLSAVLPFSSLAAPSVDQLNSSLGQQQARAQSLSASVASLSSLISSLDGQIALVQSREAAVRTELTNDRLALTGIQRSLASERALLGVLRTRLSWARTALSRQLVSSYEGDKPDLVRVVLDAHGFTDLLENVDFLHRAEQQQQALISITRAAKSQADATAGRLTKLESGERRVTQNAALRAAALAGMNSLLESKQSALAQARSAQQSALAAAQARGAQLRQEIAKVQAAQAAAQAAAARASLSPQSSSSPSSAGPAAGPALGPSGGWAIPYAIVLCESGGQNLPPNSAGASGYYQIIPSTWTGFGGSGPAAYLASKAEQDSVAARIYRGGAGVSNWDCARIVGIIH
jgi:chromosome segregation ATPase